MQARATEFERQSTGLEPALQVVELGGTMRGGGAARGDAAPSTLVVGVDRSGVLPEVDTRGYDLLLTTAAAASRPWIGVGVACVGTTGVDAELARLEQCLHRHGQPAAVLAQVLRAGEPLGLDDALVVESLAFSMLLCGEAFRAWKLERATGARTVPAGTRVAGLDRVRCTRVDDVLTVHLAHPARRNAFDAAMRDALVEALAAASDDPTLAAVELRADGPDFSAGGNLQEFGSATDPVLAHAVRTLRSPARLLGRLATRASVYLHGACVGAGIEVPAAAGRVVAAPDTRAWLPELSMGLIPGAGGTATLARRIGRQRLLHWALCGYRIDAATALSWGLVDAIEAADPQDPASGGRHDGPRRR